jgi:DNA-binding transcriptional LysR family regulator
MLTLPNFEKLKVFYVVYLNKSIQKAAEDLHVTRSAVSQSLKSLEEEIGVGLFIRDSKKFQPTAPAEELFKSINPFISDLQTTLQHLESGRKIPAGHLKIGAPMDFGSGHLTRVIGEFRKKFPEITFELNLAVPIRQLEILCRGELDMAFIDNGDIHAGKYPVTVQSVMKEEFVLAVSERRYREARLKETSVANLSLIPMVDYVSHGPVVRMWFKHHFGKVPANLSVVYSAESVRAVLAAIASDIGAGVVPKHLLVGEFKDLKTISTPKKPFVNEILLARQQGKKAVAKEQEFIKFYREFSGLKV